VKRGKRLAIPGYTDAATMIVKCTARNQRRGKKITGGGGEDCTNCGLGLKKIDCDVSKKNESRREPAP